jgi:hypothetical protein
MVWQSPQKAAISPRAASVKGGLAASDGLPACVSDGGVAGRQATTHARKARQATAVREVREKDRLSVVDTINRPSGLFGE